jgi:hypothetical protein
MERVVIINFFYGNIKYFENYLGDFYVRIIYTMKPNIKSPKIAIIFECDKCIYKCSKESDFKKHLSTRKHKNLTNPNNLGIDADEKKIMCSKCNKIYKHLSTLSAHKKKCIENINEEENKKDEILTKDDKIDILIKENIDFKNIILDLVKNNSNFQKQTLDMQQQNQDMQQKMIDVCKTSGTNNSYNNSNNKTFNMQVFLNEKCKDAMNIMDFVNSMTLQLSDLEDVGELGYVEGISKIIIRKLNEMDVYKRPIHCSDYKREVMYVRDDDIWEKENSTYDKLRKAIKHITKKNGDLMIPWRDQNPQCMNNRHRLNDVYLRIMNQSMGGKGDFVDSENKIIKKLSKAVYINKDC